MGERKGVFVTVGTTSFDKLVEAVDLAPVKEALFRRGFSHLQIQIGRGTYLPSKVSLSLCGGNSFSLTDLLNSIFLLNSLAILVIYLK